MLRKKQVKGIIDLLNRMPHYQTILRNIHFTSENGHTVLVLTDSYVLVRYEFTKVNIEELNNKDIPVSALIEWYKLAGAKDSIKLDWLIENCVNSKHYPETNNIIKMRPYMSADFDGTIAIQGCLLSSVEKIIGGVPLLYLNDTLKQVYFELDKFSGCILPYRTSQTRKD